MLVRANGSEAAAIGNEFTTLAGWLLCGSETKRKKRNPRKEIPRISGRNAGHRYRSKPKMATKNCDWETNPSVHVTYPDPETPLEVSNETNEMWDTHGFIRNWYNPLVKENYRQGDLKIPDINGDEGTLVDFKTTSPAFRDVVRLHCPFLDESALDELQLRTESKLSSVVDPTTSIANFFWELILVVNGILKKLVKGAKLVDKIRNAYKKAYKEWRSRGKSEGESHWLAWNFAVKPFFSDLRAILCSVQDALKKLKWLREHNHRDFHIDYRRDVSDLVSFDPNGFVGTQHLCTIAGAWGGWAYPNGVFARQVRFTAVKVVYHARSHVRLEIPDEYLEGGKGFLFAWEALMGLHNPVGIIWEGIPFSWLIDYFLSYRSRLFQQQSDYNVFNQHVEVLETGHSFEIDVAGDLRVHNTTFDETHANLGGFSYRIKWRRSGISLTGSQSYFRVPKDWYKLSIMAALGGGFARGYVRRRRAVTDR